MFAMNSAFSTTNNTSSAPLRITCRAWEQGRCSRGSYCRYLHATSPFSSPVSSSISEPATFSDNHSNNLTLYTDNNDDWNNAFDQLSLNHPSASKNALNASGTMLNRMSNNLNSLLADNLHTDVSRANYRLSGEGSYSMPFNAHAAFSLPKKDCWDWLSGRCTRGVSCKYAHSKGGTNELDELPNIHNSYHMSGLSANMNNNNTHSSSMSTAPRRASFDNELDISRKSKQSPLPFASASLGNELMQTTDEDVEICRFYAKHGRCKYGATCKFIHIHPCLQTAAFLSSHFSFNQLLQAGFIDRDGNLLSLHSNNHPSHSAPSSLVSSPGNSNSQSANAFSSISSNASRNNATGTSSNGSFLSLPTRAISNQTSSPLRSTQTSSYSTLNSAPISSQIGMNSKYLNNYEDSSNSSSYESFSAFQPGMRNNPFSMDQIQSKKFVGPPTSIYTPRNDRSFEKNDRSFEKNDQEPFDSYFDKEIEIEQDDSIIQNSTPPLHSFLSISTTQSPNQSQVNSPSSPGKLNSFFSHSIEILGSQTDFNLA